MKAIILTYFILSQSFIVNSSFLDSLYSKFSVVTKYFSKTFDEVSDGVKKILTRRISGDYNIRKFEDQPINAKKRYVDVARTKIKGDIRNNSDEETAKYPEFSTGSAELSIWYGKNIDSHLVKTKDGYFLTVHRFTNNTNAPANQTVLLHHGFLGSSTDWILLGPRKALPYILSDAGYDVWLANARGNYHSKGHICMTPESSNFWKFSWQEMGEFDLPAVIDYIRKVKRTTEPINFIGHSMGATTLLVLLSTLPQYNDYLKVGILLAPLVYMNNVKGPMKIMSSFSEELLKLMGDGELLPSRKVPGWLASKYCKGPKIYCRNPLFFLSGFHEDQSWNMTFVTELLYHIPAGGSTGTLLHYVQVAHNGKFHKYNAPDSEFLLRNITLPIALISSSNDWLATTPDVLKLFVSLSNPIDHHIIKNVNFTHTDFVWGANAKDLVFGKILEFLKGRGSSAIKENEV